MQRVKSDLEARLEEEQDEIEQLTGKQRHHISQITALQQQLTESSYEIEELQDTKQSSDNKVIIDSLCCCGCDLLLIM